MRCFCLVEVGGISLGSWNDSFLLLRVLRVRQK